MRKGRIKVNAAEGAAVYHCMSRTVNGEFLFDDQAKEMLRKMLWQVADFTGVKIITYTLMANHFHVLLRVPGLEAVPDDELLRRYRVLYPKPTKYQQAQVEVVARQLKTGEKEGEAWRQRQLALMGDVSQFMKLLKQRFSIWFNRAHGWFGTLWSERFKSVLVEPRDRVIATMAAYIDLNCIRAGLVNDPKNYRFCGYGEAVAGGRMARKGVMSVFGTQSWGKTQPLYRQLLFGTGAVLKDGCKCVSPEVMEKVLVEKGHLPQPEVLRCRVRYFTDGVVLGSKEFVAGYLMTHRQRSNRRRKAFPRALPPVTDWGDLAVLRSLRGGAFR